MGKFSEYPAATAGDYANATTFLIQNANGATKLATLEGLNENYFCDIRCASLTIASANVLQLNSTPLTIVGAQGVGTIIHYISGFVQIDFNSAAYATNTNLQIITSGANTPQGEGTSVLNASVSSVRAIVGDLPANTATDTQLIENADLQVTVETGDPTAGDSDITVYVLYRVVNL